jgi:hypothetical protein
MATKNFRVTGTNVPIDNNLGRLDESDQTAANRADGWTQGTKAAAQMSPFDAGTKQASTTFASTTQPASFVNGSNATANAFKTMYPLNGTFDVGNWVFTFAVRAASSATGQCGRIRLRVFKSTSYNGSVSPTELTAATQIGTTTTALSTSADRTSVVTWAPGTTIVLNNEFLFFVVAWEVTTAATNANADVLIRSGQSAGGSFLTTPNYTPVANPISNLQDSFVSSFNTSVWTDSLQASWDSGNGGQLALQCTTSYGYIDTGAQAKSYDLTGGSLIAKVTPPPTGSGSREMFMEISRIGTWGSIRDGVSLYVSGGNLGASRRLAGSVSGSATGIPYDPVNHKWWRIRESGGTIYCDTSPDGTTWNNYWSTASGFDVSAIHIDFSCGYYGTETASNGYVDEVNVPPSASTPISSSDSGVGGDWGVPTYKTEYFYDTFDTSVDLTKWNGSSSDPVWDSGGQRCRMPCVSSYATLATANDRPLLNLTGSFFMAKVTPPPVGTSSREMTMELRNVDDNTNKYMFYWQQGNLYIRRYLAGAVSGEKIVSYSASTQWWRVRESGGTIYFDTSPDGGTWTNQLTTAPGFDITRCRYVFLCGYYATESAADGYIDQINIVPPTPISATDTNGTTTEANALIGKPTSTDVNGTATEATSLALPKLETLVDTFDSSLDKAVKWPNSSSGAVWDASGRAKIPCTAGAEWIETDQNGTYNLTGSYLSAKMMPPSVGNGTREMWLEVQRGGVVNQDKFSIGVSGSTLYLRRWIAGSISGETTVAFDALNMAYWRIRESAGTIYFDTSASGQTWNNQFSVAPGFAITSVWASISSNYYGTETAADSFVDNVNYIPVAVSATDINGATTEATSVDVHLFISASDSGSSAETGSSQVLLVSADTGSGSDIASYQQGGVQFDTGTGSDNGSLNVNVLAADPYVRTYADLPNTFATYADIPANVDTYAHLPFVPVYPLATEDATVTALVPATDTNGAVVEVATIASTAVDVGTIVESTTIVAKITATADSTTLVDETAAPVFKVTVTDAGTGVDAVVTRTATLTGTDNNGAVTETQSLVAKLTDEGAQGATYDSATLVAKYTQTDGSGPTDETAVAQFVKVNVTDTNGATTETISLRLYAFDASTGTDNTILVAKFTDTDAGSSFEFALSPGGAIPGFDTGVGTEFAVPTVQQSAADVNGSVTETPVLKTQALDTDAGAIAEANVLVVKITTTDTGIGSDIADLRRLLVPVTDTNGTTTETQSAQFHIDGFESNGTVTESASVVRGLIPAFDSGAVTEVGTVSIILQTIVVSDSGTADEVPIVIQYKDDVDASGPTDEYAFSSITISAADQGIGSGDVANIGLSGFEDNVFGIEVSAVAKVVVAAGLDAGIASETASIYAHLFIVAADSSTGLDMATLVARPVVADANKPTLEFALGPVGVLPAFDVAHGLDSVALHAKLVGADVNGPTGESADSGADVKADGSGTITETQSVHAHIVASDHNLPTNDRAQKDEQYWKVTDETGQSFEGAAVKSKPPILTEAGVGSESALLRVWVKGADSGRAAEFFAHFVNIFDLDTGRGVDKGDSFVLLTTADSGYSLEYEASLGVVSTDKATGLDDSDLLALLIFFDYGTSLESEHRDPPLVLFTDQPGGDILSPAMGYIDNASAVGTASVPSIPKGTFRLPTQGRIVR